MLLEETGMWEPMMNRVFSERRKKRNIQKPSVDEDIVDNSGYKDIKQLLDKLLDFNKLIAIYFRTIYLKL